MTQWFLVEQLRTAYGFTPDEAQRIVRQLVATVQLDEVRSPENSSAFYRLPYSIGAEAGSGASHSHVALFNPVGSGETCVIKGLQLRLETAKQIVLRMITDPSPLATNDVETLDFRVPGAPRRTAALIGTFNGAAAGDFACSLWVDTVATVHEFTCILKPGTGLSVDGEANTTAVFCCFTGWIEPEQERPAP